MTGVLIRTAAAAVIAILITIIMAPLVIPFLKRLKVGQKIRDDGPQSHLIKSGTPTMGGIIIATAVMAASIIMAGFNREVLVCVFIMLAFGAIGFWDDYIKVVLSRSLGLRAREKLGLQLIIGVLFGLFLLFGFQRGTELLIPFSGWSVDISYFYILFLVLVMMGTTNGVNLNDGLDGLASGVTFFVALALIIVCIKMGHYDLTVFCGALAGACVGFWIFNRYPARIFMGDTGSMALGGAVAAVAALTRSELALIIIGGVYVIETLSVILQVFSFHAFRKRIFLMAPLHHHFEIKGWPETKVVYFFWGLSMVFCLLGVLTIRV